MSVAFHCYSSQ